MKSNTVVIFVKIGNTLSSSGELQHRLIDISKTTISKERTKRVDDNSARIERAMLLMSFAFVFLRSEKPDD